MGMNRPIVLTALFLLMGCHVSVYPYRGAIARYEVITNGCMARASYGAEPSFRKHEVVENGWTHEAPIRHRDYLYLTATSTCPDGDVETNIYVKRSGTNAFTLFSTSSTQDFPQTKSSSTGGTYLE